MRFVLLANTMEHPATLAFVRDARRQLPGVSFLHSGDLLNVFPEPGEDHRPSMFYARFGELLPRELGQLRARGFRAAEKSPLIDALQAFFVPGGAAYADARAMARSRYRTVFAELARALGPSAMYVTPGNMDYPDLAREALHLAPQVRMLDGDAARVGGLTVRGLGGIPSAAQPLHRLTAISPYEHDAASWSARAAHAGRCDVLVTHLCPHESKPLAQAVAQGPVRVVASRAAFDLSRQGSCRGSSAVWRRGGTTLLNVRPFEPLANDAYVAHVPTDPRLEVQVDTYRWRPCANAAGRLGAMAVQA